MFAKIAVYLVAIFWTAEGQNVSQIRENLWPSDLCSPFPYRTLSPINIDSSEVRLISLPTPLRITVGQFEPHCITNTGRGVTVTVNRPVLTSVSGGILGTCSYVFQQLTYYWNGDYRSDAANQIDGVGSPLHVRAVFRNTKYTTAAVAEKQRDGFVILSFNILVAGKSPNPLFTPLERILCDLKKSGSSKVTSSVPLFGWFDSLPAVEHYYAYPGSYIRNNGESSTHCDSATIIQFPRELAPYISLSQYQSFLDLKNSQGTPITNILPTQYRGNRPVVEVCGVVQNILPTTL